MTQAAFPKVFHIICTLLACMGVHSGVHAADAYNASLDAQNCLFWRIPVRKFRLKAYGTRCSQAVPHPSTILARRCLTSVIGRERVCSSWYGRRQRQGKIVRFYGDNGHCRVRLSDSDNTLHVLWRPSDLNGWIICLYHRQRLYEKLFFNLLIYIPHPNDIRKSNKKQPITSEKIRDFSLIFLSIFI